MPTFIAGSRALNDAARRLIAGARVIETDKAYGPPLLDFHLRRYEFPNGRTFTEFHCGGNYDTATLFLALKDAAGEVVPETLWLKEEMERIPQRKRAQ